MDISPQPSAETWRSAAWWWIPSFCPKMPTFISIPVLASPKENQNRRGFWKLGDAFLPSSPSGCIYGVIQRNNYSKWWNISPRHQRDCGELRSMLKNLHPGIYHGTAHWAPKKTHKTVFPTFLPHFQGGAGFALEIWQRLLPSKWLFRLLRAKAWYRDRLQPLRNAKKAMKVFTVTGKPLEISNCSICFSACARPIPARGSLITSRSLYLQIISAPQRRGFLQERGLSAPIRNPPRTLISRPAASNINYWRSE